MEYTIKWIINGEIKIQADNKEKAEDEIKSKLKALVSKNKKDFNNLGATAIQGSAS
tara:strand:- start:546 stop:713 length:168 start_codon:yes stop_codon:yes gene_type:complete